MAAAANIASGVAAMPHPAWRPGPLLCSQKEQYHAHIPDSAYSHQRSGVHGRSTQHPAFVLPPTFLLAGGTADAAEAAAAGAEEPLADAPAGAPAAFASTRIMQQVGAAHGITQEVLAAAPAPLAATMANQAQPRGLHPGLGFAAAAQEQQNPNQPADKDAYLNQFPAVKEVVRRLRRVDSLLGDLACRFARPPAASASCPCRLA